MLLSRSLSALILPKLVLSSVTATNTTLLRNSSFTVSTFINATSLGSLGAPPLVPYISSFHTSINHNFQSTERMGSESSKASDPSAFPKGKSDTEWRTVLSPAQVCYIHHILLLHFFFFYLLTELTLANFSISPPSVQGIASKWNRACFLK